MEYKKIKINKKHMGQKIKEYIDKSNYTFEQISELLELKSPRVIYSWCNGDKLPTIENLYNLSIILQVNLIDLL